MIHNILVRVIFEKSSPETCFSQKKNISLHYTDKFYIKHYLGGSWIILSFPLLLGFNLKG